VVPLLEDEVALEVVVEPELVREIELALELALDPELELELVPDGATTMHRLVVWLQCTVSGPV
jgi:hypothetical protein